MTRHRSHHAIRGVHRWFVPLVLNRTHSARGLRKATSSAMATSKGSTSDASSPYACGVLSGLAMVACMAIAWLCCLGVLHPFGGVGRHRVSVGDSIVPGLGDRLTALSDSNCVGDHQLLPAHGHDGSLSGHSAQAMDPSGLSVENATLTRFVDAGTTCCGSTSPESRLRGACCHDCPCLPWRLVKGLGYSRN